MGSNNRGARPIDPATKQSIGPLEQPGYYPGYRTLEQQKFWDAKTRDVVLERVIKVPPIRFFTPEEARVMKAVCDRIIPQDDRAENRRIPILPRIDERLFENRHDGYRYESMPPDREVFQLGAKAINEIARHLHQRDFADLDMPEQESILKSLHDGKPPAAHDIWQRMPVNRFWMMLVQDCAEAYYAHPWAWDEIGYGGPAYPRGYMRLEKGQPEPWERPERRYAWEAPPGSLSDTYEPSENPEENLAAPGQGGTH
jgi:hypothetical protein